MERWKALIIFLCLCAAAYGQDSARIGLDMAETVGNGNIRIVISHAFAPQWSAGGSASFRIINDIASYMDFPEAGLSEWEISFRHWATECYKGGYISLGMTECGYKDRHRLFRSNIQRAGNRHRIWNPYASYCQTQRAIHQRLHIRTTLRFLI